VTRKEVVVHSEIMDNVPIGRVLFGLVGFAMVLGFLLLFCHEFCILAGTYQMLSHSLLSVVLMVFYAIGILVGILLLLFSVIGVDFNISVPM
jgi:hypothetical protein